MEIRRAAEKDISKIKDLLGQVLGVHAQIRPDIFIPGTTKYTDEELSVMIKNDRNPIYVAVDDDDTVIGYAFCELREQPFSNNMIPFISLFIDDLCVDESARGMRIGQQLFEHVKKEAEKFGCYEVTLNVWEGNDSARHFYDKMGMRVKETMMELIL